MNYFSIAILKYPIRTVLILLLISLTGGCAELDQLTKPSVEGLQKAVDFNYVSLVEGGINKTQVRSSISSKDFINEETYQPMLKSAIRNKRPELVISSNGRYQVTASLIANDISHREDNLSKIIYKWSKRRIRISYVVIDTSTGEQAWSGIIETYDEQLSSYDQKKKKSSDKVLDVIAAAINKKELYPYPDPPFFSDVMKRNFEGFALNLPLKK